MYTAKIQLSKTRKKSNKIRDILLKISKTGKLDLTQRYMTQIYLYTSVVFTLVLLILTLTKQSDFLVINLLRTSNKISATSYNTLLR